MYINCVREKENLRFDFLNPIRLDPPNVPLKAKKALRLTVTLSGFVNYFAPLGETEPTTISAPHVWASLRAHRREARRQISARRREESAQVEQDESSTRNS